MKNQASEIAALITIKMYLVQCIDNVNIKLTKEEVKLIQAQAAKLDRAIIDQSLSLKLEKNSLSDLENHTSP